MPNLVDAYGQVVIGPPTGDFGRSLVAMGATSLIFNSIHRRLGVYVDCETGTAPVESAEQKAQRDTIAKALHARIPAELVVVSIYPDEVGHSIPGCVCPIIHFPYAYDYDALPLPAAQGFIFAKEYFGVGRKPTLVELSLMIVAARSRSTTRLIWVY